jgi:hypothetical protein
MAAQILRMTALHDYNHCARLGIVDPGRHHDVPPIERPFPNGG